MKRYASVASQNFSINKPQSQENNAYIFKMHYHVKGMFLKETRPNPP